MKVAVVGCRGFGRVHLEALRSMGSVDIYVFSRDRAAAEACANEWGASGFFTSYDDVLRSSVDVVDLVVDHASHLEMSVKAFKAGKHVLLEKPIARTLEEGLAIIKAAEESGVKFMVAENHFFDPAARKAAELSKDLGVHTIIARGLSFHAPTGWRAKLDEMGGGSLIDGGIHLMDTFLNIGGDYEAVCGSSRRAMPQMEGESASMALFKFKSGAVGAFMYGWAFPNSPRVPLFEVYGVGGSIVEDPASRVRGRNYGDILFNGERIELPKVNTVQLEIEGFLRSIREGTEVPMPPQLALRDLRAVLDIYTSNCP
ncbi:oxidoreductase [Thermocladium modestius]|uniref:Oxidoreductase n=1 Tax=Thermocladium modestius TaxID=62609 RepID=A0A830GUT8_9CREN|nr:Gfo/Idh/MocA family oxidoreductase [Thermocladium modestius]GGP20013.1 oxidoreductase [Thermocladium modestius]